MNLVVKTATANSNNKQFRSVFLLCMLMPKDCDADLLRLRIVVELSENSNKSWHKIKGSSSIKKKQNKEELNKTYSLSQLLTHPKWLEAYLHAYLIPYRKYKHFCLQQTRLFF
jgi:hypothetical protein